MRIDFHVWDAILEHYFEHIPKLANIVPNGKSVLPPTQNDLLHKFID